MSKKQTAVSRSTTESEVIALAQGIFAEALPMCTFWETVLRRKINLVIFEDNEATEKVVRSGYSQQLRHITRTHKVKIASIKEILDLPEVHLRHVMSDDQCADVFTKFVGTMPYIFWGFLKKLQKQSKSQTRG